MVAVLLTGCRIDLVAELDLRADGSGTAVVELFLDRELLGLLDDLEVDAVGEVEAAAGVADDWDVEVLAEGADGLRLRLEHEGSDPAGALSELSAGLAPQDPGLHADLEVQQREVGEGTDELELTGELRLAAPEAPGVIDEADDGELLGPDRAALEALTREHVTGALAVTMPGTVRSHDAREADGSTLRWDLPVEQPVAVAAVAEVGSLPLSSEVLVTGAGVLLLLVGITLVWLARRRSA